MSTAPRTRHSLLLELRRHSDDAWAEFLEVYEGAIHGFCRAMGLQDADASDATQEVLAAVHARIPTWELDARGSFRAWLFRVARNVAVDAIAQRARATTPKGGSEMALALSEIAGPEALDPAASEDTFEAEVQRALIERAGRAVRREVRESTWRAFQLTAVQGLAAEEAAERLGMSVGSVYTAKCRVVARIRECVHRWSGEVPVRSASRDDA